MLKSKNSEEGYTLVELIWASLLALLVLSSVLGAFYVGMRTSTLVYKTTSFVDRATVAVRYMQKYIRQASIISEADSSYIRITVEKARQEGTYDTLEFYIRERNLYQRVNGREKIIAENVRNEELNVPLFKYFKEGGQEITDPTLKKTLVKSIQITLVIDDNLNLEPPAFTISEIVSLRNFNI